MKKSVLLLVFALSMTVIGCKKEKAEDNSEAPKEEVVASNGFNVVLDVVIKQDDEVLLFYTTDGGTDFSKIPPLTQKVKGSASPQLISYTLPEGAKPTEFRVDFGTNPQKEDIYFNKITFRNLGKERTIACPEMLDYFRANDTYCTFNTTTGLIQTKTSPSGEKYSASIYPHEKNVLAALEKLW
ncbi:MAG: hypothetical protein QM710_09195 [Flavobacterium sp.]